MRYHALRSVAASVLLLAAASLVGCSSDSPTETALDVSGDYALQTVAGEQLPTRLYEDDEVSVVLLSGVVVLSRDGNFEETLTFRETPAGTEQGEVFEVVTAGTYQANGETIDFVYSEDSWTATLSGNTITYSIWQLPFVFRK
jgi:hypothetical protein